MLPYSLSTPAVSLEMETCQAYSEIQAASSSSHSQEEQGTTAICRVRRILTLAQRAATTKWRSIRLNKT